MSPPMTVAAATGAGPAKPPTKPPWRTSGIPSRLRSAPMTVAAPIVGAAMVDVPIIVGENVSAMIVGLDTIGAGMIVGAAMIGAATCVTTGAGAIVSTIVGAGAWTILSTV